MDPNWVLFFLVNKFKTFKENWEFSRIWKGKLLDKSLRVKIRVMEVIKS